jgi:hypothetical protein
MMSIKALEAKLNRRLKEVNPSYSIRNLKRLPNGGYWFDLAMAFNAKDLAKVNRIFAQHLGKRERKRETVQAKFYLTPQTYARLRKSAAHRGVPQSALVEEALQTALAS